MIPEDLPRYYANFALVEPAGMDVTMTMGHQIGAEAPVWSARVTMSWEEAKFLVNALNAQIEMYEAAFGNVRDVMKSIQDFAAQRSGVDEPAANEPNGDE